MSHEKTENVTGQKKKKNQTSEIHPQLQVVQLVHILQGDY